MATGHLELFIRLPAVTLSLPFRRLMDLTLLDCRSESVAVDNYSGQGCEYPDIDLSITT